MVSFTQTYAAHMGVTHNIERVNCQDAAFACDIETPVGIIQLGLVLDGCSTTLAPEVGVKSAIKYIPTLVKELFNIAENVPFIAAKPWLVLNALYISIQARITEIAILLGPETAAEFDQVIFDHFMFTIQGYLITPWYLLSFRAGDGVLIVNNELINAYAPSSGASYLGHTLISPDNPKKVCLEKERFEIRAFDVQGVSRVLVSTDGLAYDRGREFITDRAWECNSNIALLEGLGGLFVSKSTYDDMAVAKATRPARRL
jgi:hypothetical protein